ncbi:MAG: hypothetical protein WAT79_08510 [Saprospiraceae bacterium]
MESDKLTELRKILKAEALKKVDWKLLKKQKNSLVEVNIRRTVRKQDQDALDSIIHLLDALQDEHDGIELINQKKH